MTELLQKQFSKSAGQQASLTKHGKEIDFLIGVVTDQKKQNLKLEGVSLKQIKEISYTTDLLSTQYKKVTELAQSDAQSKKLDGTYKSEISYLLDLLKASKLREVEQPAAIVVSTPEKKKEQPKQASSVQEVEEEFDEYAF